MHPLHLVLAAASAQLIGAINNGLGRLPPMGWNTWCVGGHCGTDICTEEEIKSVAESLISTGLQAAGYTRVNLDE